MKEVKLYIATLLFTAFGLVSNAQTIGIKTGANFANVNSELYIDAVNNAFKTNTNFLIGVYGELPLHTNISFQPELQFIQKGFSASESTSVDILGLDIPLGASVETNINYIETPMLFKFKTSESNAKAYALAGPAIGYATSANLEPKVMGFLSFNLPDQSIDLSSDIYNRVDISGIVGVGGSIDFGNNTIFTDIRYQHSFNNMLNDPIVDLMLSNKGFQINAGYGFRF